MCKSKDNLEVHHKVYHPDRRAWEYTKDELEVLCDDCHRKIHGLPSKGKVTIRTKEEVETEERLRHEFLMKNDPNGTYAHMYKTKYPAK